MWDLDTRYFPLHLFSISLELWLNIGEMMYFALIFKKWLSLLIIAGRVATCCYSCCYMSNNIAITPSFCYMSNCIVVTPCCYYTSNNIVVSSCCFYMSNHIVVTLCSSYMSNRIVVTPYCCYTSNDIVVTTFWCYSMDTFLPIFTLASTRFSTFCYSCYYTSWYVLLLLPLHGFLLLVTLIIKWVKALFLLFVAIIPWIDLQIYINPSRISMDLYHQQPFWTWKESLNHW